MLQKSNKFECIFYKKLYFNKFFFFNGVTWWEGEGKKGIGHKI